MTPWGRSISAWVRTAVGPGEPGTADGELLARFALHRDQAAFELLVWRHGGLVLRTALAITRDHHLAEDVSQAVFLVLARKAGSLHDGDALVGWLHTTARRVALRAKPRATVTPPGTPPAALEAGLPDDVSAVVQEEVARLPERYRLPVLLCFYEGLTHAEAAARLGKPVGSVAGWIARAKAQLHDRLTRRGVTLPAAGLVGVLAVGPAPARLVESITAGALAYAGGTLTASPLVVTLVHGAYRAMILAKLKVAATATAVALGGVGLTAGGWALTSAQVPGGLGGPPGTGVKGVTRSVVPQPGKPAAPAEAPEDARKLTLSQSQRSRANLKKLMIGMHNYHDAHTRFPTAIVDPKTKQPLLSWRVVILPYVGEEKLYTEFKLDESWDSEHNFKLLVKMPDFLRVGFEPEQSTHTYYQVVQSYGAALYPLRANNAGVGGIGGFGGTASGGGAPPGDAAAMMGSGRGAPGGLGGPPGSGAGMPPGGFGSPAGSSGPPGVGAGSEGGPPGTALPPGNSGRGAPGGGPPTSGGYGSAGGAGDGGAGGGGGRIVVPEPTFITITDGSSNTVGVVECGPPVPWTKPADLKVANLNAGLPALAWPFNNAMQFSMMDGSTRLFARTLPEKTLRGLMTAAGGEVITDEMLAHPVRLPATTAEEKALLAKSLAENERLVAEIGKAALEHGRLLGERARATGDLFEAEGTTEQLKQMLEDIRLKNVQLAAPPAVAAPKK